MGNKIKNYVLDTNILIHCPDSILKFDNNNVYITHTTIEELDGLKNASGETGWNAREASRLIKQFREQGKLVKGVKTPGGGKFFVYTSDIVNKSLLPEGWNKEKADNIILLMVQELKKVKSNVILVTNDMNMMVKADVMGIDVQEYKNDRVSPDKEFYKGRRICSVSEEAIQSFDKTGCVDKKYIKEFDELEINEFIVLESSETSRLAYFDGTRIKKLKYDKVKPYGIRPRNVGQMFAQEAMLSDVNEVPLVILKGPAGTGKTFYALACGLQQVINDDKYKRILICRPNVKFDEDIGYLKGTEMDKILPLIRPCLDNLEDLIENQGQQENMLDSFFEVGLIRAEALAYIRGRSIKDTFIIIDEAQNSSPNQMLGIITRAGSGSKICVIGDPDQIDNPRLDKYNNGLVFASDRMKGSANTMQLAFTEEECTRSALAKEASDRLSKKYVK